MTQIKRVKCLHPFLSFSVHQFGYCYSCCTSWTRIGNVGKLVDGNSIMQVWNSDKMQTIRRAVLHNDLREVCNFTYCPYAMDSNYIDLEAVKNDDPRFNFIIDQIMAGKTELESPPYMFTVSSSGRCNLKCSMCQAEQKFSRDDDLLDEKLFSKVIPDILPGISRLYLMGNGEVLFNPHSRKFLQTLNPDKYPLLKIDLLTNGTLFTPRLWETISHNHYDTIGVSIDAATKETYQSIRRNGNWDTLLNNLELISELRAKKVFNRFSLYFCVMKSNYKEMKQFVELGKSLGCDQIEFTKIFGNVVDENINLTANKKIFSEIASILADPIFKQSGVSTLMIDDYRKYAQKDVTPIELLVTRLKEIVYFLPTKILYLLSKKHFFHKLLDKYAALKRAVR